MLQKVINLDNVLKARETEINWNIFSSVSQVFTYLASLGQALGRVEV